MIIKDKKETKNYDHIYFGDIYTHVKKYDFVVNSLQDFDLNKFFSVGQSISDDEFESNTIEIQSENSHGGFILITEKQYLLGQNNVYSTETHYSAFAKAYEVLHNLPPIDNPDPAVPISNREAAIKEGFRRYDAAFEEYICARFAYENVGGIFKRYAGYIDFDLKDTVLTAANIDKFNEFYLKYNKTITSLCNRKNINIMYTLPNGQKKENCGSLDDLKDDLNSYLNENESILPTESLNPSEKIIDIPLGVPMTISFGR